MIRSADVRWRPAFQLHEWVVDEDRCDSPEEAPANGQYIRYLPGHFVTESVASVPTTPGCTSASFGFSFIDLFSGIGGFRLALEACGGKCVFASEVDPWAIQVYNLNFQDEGLREVAGDIRKVSPVEVPPLDVLTAAFPPNSFTSKDAFVGQSGARGFRDKVGQLVWHVIRLLRAWRREGRHPKAVLLENVTGIMKNDVARQPASKELAQSPAIGEQWLHTNSALPAILSALSMSGYSVSWKTYDSQAVVPQARPRVYVVGLRDDVAEASGAAGRGFMWPRLPELRPSLGSILHGADRDGLSAKELEEFRLAPEQWRAVEASSHFLAHAEERLPSLEGPTNAIRGSYRRGWRVFSQFVPLEPSEQSAVPYRFLTPRECARLQGLPDSFQLTGTDPAQEVPEVAQYRLVGNVIQPPVVEVLAAALLGALDLAPTQT